MNFQYVTFIKCQEDEKISNICNNFLRKSGLNGNGIKYFYSGKGGDEFDQNLTFNEMANSIDQKRKKMTFIVLQDTNNKNINNPDAPNINNNITINNDNKQINSINKKISKYIICPECGDPIRMEMNEYKINLYKCQNYHKVNDILLNNFEETQIIKDGLIQNYIDRYEKFQNRRYSYICKKHDEPILNICKKCSLFLCSKCQIIHINSKHEIIPVLDKDAALKKLEGIKEKIKMFNNNIERIIGIFNHVKENVNNYYKITENLINNYELNEKVINETILNMHELINDNKILKDINK